MGLIFYRRDKIRTYQVAASHCAAKRSPKPSPGRFGSLYIPDQGCSIDNKVGYYHLEKIRPMRSMGLIFYRSDKIRTCGLYIPNVAL